jgi:magnesium chelatase subunit H
VIPDDVAGRVKVKVVYTVLEAQYQSALSAAVKEINKTNKTVRGVVGLQG